MLICLSCLLYLYRGLVHITTCMEAEMQKTNIDEAFMMAYYQILAKEDLGFLDSLFLAKQAY